MNTSVSGWFGMWGQAAHAIRTVGGDIGKDGQPWVTGVAFFLGMKDEQTEVVVGPDSYYYVNGDAQGLAALMNSTSYGVRNVGVYNGLREGEEKRASECPQMGSGG